MINMKSSNKSFILMLLVFCTRQISETSGNPTTHSQISETSGNLTPVQICNSICFGNDKPEDCVDKLETCEGKEVHKNINGITNALNKSLILDSATTTHINQICNKVSVVGSLPFSNATLKEEVLKNLRLTEAKTTRIRNKLIGMAERLKGECEWLISIYQDRDLLSSEAQLNKLVVVIGFFVDYAKNAKGTLTEAGDILSAAQEVLADTTSALITYDVELKRVKQLIEDKLRKYRENGTRSKRSIMCLSGSVCTIIMLGNKQIGYAPGSVGTDGTSVAIENIVISSADLGSIGTNAAARVDIAEEDERYEKAIKLIEDSKKTVDSIQSLITTFIEKSNDLDGYVATELKLIDDWKLQLQPTITDQEGITCERIKWASKMLIDNLQALIASCDAYLAHESPSNGRKKRGLPFSMDSRTAISGYPGTAQTSVAQWPHAVARRDVDSMEASTFGVAIRRAGGAAVREAYPCIENTMNTMNLLSTHLTEALSRTNVLDKSRITEIKEISNRVAAVKALPFSNATLKEEVLTNLYRTEDKIVRIRNVLEGMAERLKGECEGLISLYEDPDLLSPEDQLEKLVTVIDLFVDSARNAKEILRYAGGLLSDTQYVLARTTTALITYDDELKRVKQLLQDQLTQYRENGGRSKRSFVCHSGSVCIIIMIGDVVIGSADPDFVGTDVTRVDIEEEDGRYEKAIKLIEDSKKTVDSMQNLIKTLNDNIENINNDIETDFNLKNDCMYNLKRHIRRGQHSRISYDLKQASNILINSLKAVVAACNAHLAHDLPSSSDSGRPASSERPSTVTTTTTTTTTTATTTTATTTTPRSSLMQQEP